MERAANTLLDKVLQNRILLHVLFWAFVLLIAPLTSTESIDTVKEAYLFRAIALPMKIIPTYFLVYFLIPRYLQQKRYLLFGLYFILSTAAFTVIYRYNNIHIAETLAGMDQPKESLQQIIYEFKYTFFGYFFRVYFFTLIFFMIKIFRERAAKQRQIESLLKEKAQAELNFLKAQIHPHFLFNTLNNLYALSLDKSDEAPEVVAKLSEMLDYMLYQCKAPKVLVSKEIKLLENYIDLEKIRYGHRLKLDFTHKLDHPKAMIAPLILISFVENAFKHGVSDTLHDAIINIKLVVKDDQLHFNVFNTKTRAEQSDQMDYKKGIGINNVKRQLELTYPGQYQLHVDGAEESYEVGLSIIL